MKKYLIGLALMLSSCAYGQNTNQFGSPAGTACAGGPQTITDISVTPAQQYVCAGSNGHTWSAVGGGGVTYGATAIGTLYGIGDSTMAGSYASTPGNSAFSILARDYPGNAVNLGNPGAMMASITDSNFQYLLPILKTDQLPVYYENGGINDANSIGANTGSVNNYTLELNAATYWTDLLPASKFMASTATAVGFSASYSGATVTSAVTGTAKQSITVGDTLTFSGTAVGNKVGLTYSPRVSGTGTFTVSLNGTLQTDVCSGTTTFSAFGCNGQAVSNDTFFRQEFSVAPGTAYTLVVTVTGSTGATNIVGIIDVDTTPTSSTGLPVYIMSGVIKQNADAKSTDTAAFDAAASAVIAQAASDHLNVFFANVRTGANVVNSSTDMAASTSACPALSGNSPLHPNDCGYLHWAAAIESAVTGVFRPGNGRSPTLFAPPSTYIPTGSSDSSYAAWESNLSKIIPNSSIWAPVYCSFPSTFCTGINYSATQNTYTNALWSPTTVAVQHCTGSTPSGCTDSDWWDANGEQHTKGSIQLGSTAAPICSATVAGQIQYTQGNSSTKDVVQVCAHDASNVYAWRTIY